MDKEKMEEFKGRSKVVLQNIEELQAEIKKYKKGAESFQMAGDLLEDLAGKQRKIIEDVEEYVAGLYKLDAEEILDKLLAVSGTVKKAEKGIEEALDEMVGFRKSVSKISEEVSGVEERLEKLAGRVEVMEEGYIKAMRKKG